MNLIKPSKDNIKTYLPAGIISNYFKLFRCFN